MRSRLLKYDIWLRRKYTGNDGFNLNTKNTSKCHLNLLKLRSTPTACHFPNKLKRKWTKGFQTENLDFCFSQSLEYTLKWHWTTSSKLKWFAHSSGKRIDTQEKYSYFRSMYVIYIVYSCFSMTLKENCCIFKRVLKNIKKKNLFDT